MKILQQVTRYCGKEEKLLLKSNFSSFLQYFKYISNFSIQITYWLVKCGCSIHFSSICKCDMSRYWYIEVFQKIPWISRWRGSTVLSQLFVDANVSRPGRAVIKLFSCSTPLSTTDCLLYFILCRLSCYFFIRRWWTTLFCYCAIRRRVLYIDLYCW